MKIWRDYNFEAAHFLPQVPKGHKCRNMHGHSYRVRIWIEAEVDPDMGWAIDFADVDSVMDPIIAPYDHTVLNDIMEEVTTAENVAARIWRECSLQLPGHIEIEVSETGDSGVVFSGPCKRM